MTPLMLLAALVSSAFASTVVVYAGVSREAAVTQAATDTGRPAADLSPVTLTELMGSRGPLLVGPGRIEPCVGLPSDNAQIERHLAAAENAINYLDPVAATAALDQADAAQLCLGEAAQPTLAGRAAFLRGIVAVDAGDEQAARKAFAQAHVYAPGTAWDSAFPPNGRRLFDEAAAEVASRKPVRLAVLPSGGGFSVRVDGQAPLDANAAPVTPATHIVQVGAAPRFSTVRVTITDDATVVLPALVRPSNANWVTEPLTATRLATVLATAVPADADVIVVLPDSTWSGNATQGWSVVARHTPKWSRRSAPNTVLLATGAGLGLGGGALAVASLIQGSAAADEADSAGAFDEWTLANTRYEGARSRLLIGEGIAALGTLAFGVGLAVPLGAPPDRATISFWTTPGGTP